MAEEAALTTSTGSSTRVLSELLLQYRPSLFSERIAVHSCG